MRLFNKSTNAANGAPVTHHRIAKVQLTGDLSYVEAYIQSWSTEQDRLDGKEAVGNFYVTFPTAGVALGSGLLAGIVAAVLADGQFFGGTETADASLDLGTTKIRKLAELYAAKTKAENKKVTFGGAEYRMDLGARAKWTQLMLRALAAKINNESFSATVETAVGGSVTLDREQLINTTTSLLDAWNASNANIQTLYQADVDAVNAATTIEAVLTVEPAYEGDPE